MSKRIEGQLDHFIQAVKDNQKSLLIAGAVAGTAALGFYGFKKMHHSNEMKLVSDKQFSQLSTQYPLQLNEAVFRERFLSNIQYDLVLNLHPKDSIYYSGRIKISFMVNEQVIQEDLKNLFLDFHGQGISDMTVNQNHVPLSSLCFDSHRIMIPYENIKLNAINHLIIKFTNTFEETGRGGLMKYFNPVDNEIYIFSNLEPFNCNRWFPCFDQPSLRASLKLQVLSPEAQWQIISNGKKVNSMAVSDINSKNLLDDLGCSEFLEPYEDKHHSLLVIHSFEDTPSISTHLFGLFCGRFKCYIDQDQEKFPIRLFQSHYHDIKQSLLIEPKEIFRIIQVGLQFYEEQYGIKYPFSKLDLVFCPNLNTEAIHSEGTIVLNQNNFLAYHEQTGAFRELPMINASQRLTQTLLEQLSQIWFGDLVSMKWWNDIWLTQAFNKFMALQCTNQCNELKKYRSTENIMIDAIAQSLIFDTSPYIQSLNFSAISTTEALTQYESENVNKGVIFFWILTHNIGYKGFQAGIKEYFAKYKFQNTDTKELIDSFQIGLSRLGSNQEIRLWCNLWLQKQGVNIIHTIIERDLINQSFTLNLKASNQKHGDQHYFDQKLDVALYDQDMNETTIENVRIYGDHVKNIFSGNLELCPAAILVNSNCKGYCRVHLDQQSLNHFLINLSKVKNAVNRAYLYRVIFDQIKLRNLKPNDYLEALFTEIVVEENFTIIPSILNDINYCLKYYYTNGERKILQGKYQKVLLSMITRSETLNLKNYLTKELLENAINMDRDSEMLIQWLDLGRITNQQDNSVVNILTQEHKFIIVRLLHRSRNISLFDLRKRLEDVSSSIYLQNQYLKDVYNIEIESSFYEDEQKQKVWDKYVSGEYNIEDFKISSRYFYNLEDDEMCEIYGSKFFKVIEQVFKERDYQYAKIFFQNLSPVFLGREHYLDDLLKILERQVKENNHLFVKLLKYEIELLEEIIEIRSTQNVIM
ncbi:aminopeptidase n [Stylonychia lemnae]|uniref:Aminopeptidase n n=1 Tax=Stylonychia lemnae TaxID=5949 RepID=A0A078BA68_STYLE|nr:aminopeptidase n [Stylonychia lemnae]|eukprot:CDW91141.1 aminopeptidase n [Stylonychia lemnae]